MSESEDTTNAFVAFFSKIAGDKDYWIFWAAISVAAWVGFILTSDIWFLLVGITTAIVIILTIITKLYRLYKNNRRIKQIAIQQAKEDRIKAEQARLNEQSQIENRKKLIWKYIANISVQDRFLASCILNYPMHDGNKLIRFIKNTKYPNDDEGKLFHAIWSTVDHFRFVCKNGINRLYLIDREQIREGYFVTIDSYLYDILEHYKNTDRWEKL